MAKSLLIWGGERGVKRGEWKSRSVNMSVNSWKTNEMLIIRNYHMGPAKKNDAKINPRANK